MSEVLVLSQVKENILFFKSKNWFLPASVRTFKFPKVGKLGYREAAVLFLITYQQNKLHVLLTKRSTFVRTFKGHACLPGGGKDNDDASLIETALREAEEEIGLDRKKVEVICSLPAHCSGQTEITVVTPVVALLKDPPEGVKWTLNPMEVDCTYWVPLEFFLDGSTKAVSNELDIAMYIYADGNTLHSIYGLTANICLIISSMVLNRAPSQSLSQYQPFLISDLVTDDKFVFVKVSRVLLTREEAVRATLGKNKL